MISAWFKEIFGQKISKCQEVLHEETIDGRFSLEDEELMEERTSFIPSFSTLLNPIKALAMSYPGMEINGFKFNFGTALSNNFSMLHELSFAPKKPQAHTGNPMMDLFGEKNPFYSVNLQYNHGVFTPTYQNLLFSLVGRVDSLGRVDAIFFKSFKNFTMKIQTQFPNSNIAYSSAQADLEYQSKYTKHTVSLATHNLNYGIVEKIGNKLMVGLECNYLVPRNQIGTGIAARYAHTPNEKLFFQYSALSNVYSLGSSFKLTNDTHLGIDLELGGQNTVSSLGLGYRKKTKCYQVDSAIRTDGELKSFFSYNHQMFCKLKLFLSGNIITEDFKTGVTLSFGQTDD